MVFGTVLLPSHIYSVLTITANGHRCSSNDCQQTHAEQKVIYCVVCHFMVVFVCEYPTRLSLHAIQGQSYTICIIYPFVKQLHVLILNADNHQDHITIRLCQLKALYATL